MEPKNWYDWADLLECFNTTLEDFKSEDESNLFKDEKDAATFLRSHINRISAQLISSDEPLSEQDTTFIAAARQLVANVGEGMHECAPLFEGMARITSDGTFLKYLHVLLQHVWD